ncbi:MAG: hypothetical protein IIA07_03005 [Proteobacteria bacterium]|nr:hypothetical protein [Pseudomonadota bacterium]
MGDIVFHPGVQFKSVEGNALLTDGNVGEKGPDLGVEAVAVHAEIGWSIAKAYEPR